jgi:hypothetical protein
MRDQQDDHLQHGKGRSYFVKSQLKRLRQEDDIWEADFFPVPQQGLWIGLVISHTDDFVLAHQTIEESPTVNDLAQLLAEAMRRPLVAFSHRPRSLYIRERPEWAELLPHLKQVGIEVVYQDKLPKWDDAFGDLYAQVEGNGPGRKKRLPKFRKEPSMARKSSSPVKLHKPAETGEPQLYPLEIFLMSGPISEKFAKKNPVISRTIQIRGDQTLEDLHSLGLEVGRHFGYWFDFGDDWWHQIDVTAIEEKVPAGKYPKVTKKVGKSPPQYADE